MTWITCPKPVVGDVIRWQEPIWAAPTKKRGKPDQIGEQRLSAKVTAVGDYVQLQIKSTEVLSMHDGQENAPLKVKEGDAVKRKTSTIERGDCHRLPWDDESARPAT